VRWAGHATRTGDTRKFGQDASTEEPPEDLGAYEKVLKWIIGKRSERVMTGYVWFRKGMSDVLL
jgi:hypothetical protein